VDPVRLLAIARKEAIQLRRDRRSMMLAFALPILLLVFFGYAITLDVDELPLAVLDQDRSAESRHLIERLQAGNYFVLVRTLDSYGQVDRVLLTGEAAAVLIVPPGFAQKLDANRSSPVQLLVDGSDANTATIALGYADAIVAAHSTGLGSKTADPRTIGHAPLDVRTRIWYNPELESRNMIVPGLIAVIMAIIAALLTALTIAREWERGTMEQLASTPVGRGEVVLGKLIPYAVIGTIDVALTVIAGVVVFDVPLRGNLLLLAVLTLLFLAGALGFGLFLSAALKSQLLATQAAIMSTFLPAVLLSGFLYDIASMPVAVRAVTFLVPASYFVTVTRGIFLKDVGLTVLWPEALAMLVFATVGLGLAARMYRKQVA
jgi:ABC-2 type transport system permease protein